jgi:hypothetical protein
MDSGTNVNANPVSAVRPLQVMCLRCDAKPDEPCVQPGRNIPLIGGYHAERVELVNRLLPHLPEIPANLDASQITLIVYYAFIMLADSVSENSEKMIGTKQSSENIQRFFGRKAIEELQRVKLLD